jgi:hypothetical protein
VGLGVAVKAAVKIRYVHELTIQIVAKRSPGVDPANPSGVGHDPGPMTGSR